MTLLPARRRPVAVRLAAAGTALALVASCRSAPRAPLARLPLRPPTLGVTMTEYHFAYKKSVPAGRVVVRARNSGRTGHRLTLVSLPEDLPSLEGRKGPVGRVVPEVAAIPALRPGEGGSMALDLVPGRYAFVCFLVDADGQSHADKGMISEFRVAAGAGPPSGPRAGAQPGPVATAGRPK